MKITYDLLKSDQNIQCDFPITRIFESIDDGKYILSIEKVFQKRSNNQNRYFHGVLLPMLAEHMGMIVQGIPRKEVSLMLEATKEYIISHYCPKLTIKNQKDKRRRITIQKRTSKLTTDEFRVMVDSILKDFPFIPPPNSKDLESLIAYYTSLY
jgi:hypothetical protein